MPTWETAADWDAAVSEAGVVHESVANTDHDDAGVVKQGYSIQDPYLSSDLVGYWPLQEDSGSTAYDFSGNNNDGTLNGGVTQGVTGLLGTSAYSFDGSDDYVDVPDSASLDIGGGDHTWIFWFKTTTAPNDGRMVGLGGQKRTEIRPTTSNNLTWAIDDNTTKTTLSLSWDYSDGDWRMVAARRDYGNTLYLDVFNPDGTVDSNSVSDDSGDCYDGLGLHIGALPYYDTPYYPGELGYIYLYKSFISDTNIQKLHDVVATQGSLTTDWRQI